MDDEQSEDDMLLAECESFFGEKIRVSIEVVAEIYDVLVKRVFNKKELQRWPLRKMNQGFLVILK